MLKPRLGYFLAFLIALAACGKGTGNFIGKWQEIDKTEVLEFFPDGRVSVADQGMATTGNWTTLDGGRLKIEAPWMGMTLTFTGGLRKDTLHLVGPDGDTASYRRVPAPD